MWLGISDLVVFLVEPSRSQAKVMTAALERLGVRRVDHFASGAEVLAEMRRRLPGVLISALYLPDMTGTDLVHTLRGDATLEPVPFILISSETRAKLLEPIRQSGVCGILPKPFADEQLKAALTATVDYLRDDDSLIDFGVDTERLRVLIVDDSRTSRNFITRILESVGIHHVLEAEAGPEALRILAETPVDLVLTDYNMPEMDGRALIEHIRSQGWQQSVPILMVTSEQDNGRLAAVEQAGVTGIFDKPFDPASVKAMLVQLFAT